MNVIAWIIFALWGVVGLLNMTSPEISRVSYFCVWLVMMGFLLEKAVC